MDPQFFANSKYANTSKVVTEHLGAMEDSSKNVIGHLGPIENIFESVTRTFKCDRKTLSRTIMYMLVLIRFNYESYLE